MVSLTPPTPRLMLYNAQYEPLKEAKEGKGCTQCRCLPELLFQPTCSCPPQFEKNGGQHLPPTLDCTGPQRPGLGGCHCFTLGTPEWIS